MQYSPKQTYDPAQTADTRSTTAAGSLGRTVRTATVAPTKPTKAKKCQGRNEDAAPSVEVSELIIQARIKLGVDANGRPIDGHTLYC